MDRTEVSLKLNRPRDMTYASRCGDSNRFGQARGCCAPCFVIQEVRTADARPPRVDGATARSEEAHDASSGLHPGSKEEQALVKESAAPSFPPFSKHTTTSDHELIY